MSSMDEIVAFCKRRGFLVQNSEIYGGLQGVYDYGPLGVELKNNLKMAWWKAMVYDRDDIEGIDAAILTHRLTLLYSGHEETFSDPMVDCKACQRRMRADHVQGVCEFCGSKELTEPRPFNLMLRTNLGPVENATSYGYLRPETAQAIFTNFKYVVDTTARKLPFGIAQIGKAFRNEVTPKNFIFRTREFEQMELEFFVPACDDEKWHRYWVQQRYEWWLAQGLSAERLQLQPQAAKELAHYSKATTDLVYKFPFGMQEIEGIANRTDFDLGSHSKVGLNLVSKVKENHDSTATLAITEAGHTTVPFVIEPSAGVDRGVLAILSEAYHRETLETSERMVLRLKAHLAPIKVAVIPLAKNNPKIVAKAQAIKKMLQQNIRGRVKYEDSGNIGKAYRRHDEIGTPLCLTVDFDTFEKSVETVTLRDRDSMQQQRIAVEELADFMKEYFA